MSSTEKKFKYTRSATLPEITFHYLYDHEYPDIEIYNNQTLLIIYDAPGTDGPIIRLSFFRDNCFMIMKAKNCYAKNALKRGAHLPMNIKLC